MTSTDSEWKRVVRHPIRITTPDDAEKIQTDFNSYANTILETDAETAPETVQPTIEEASASETPTILIIHNFDALDDAAGTTAAQKIKSLSEQFSDDLLVLLTNVDSLSTYEPDLRGRVKNTT